MLQLMFLIPVQNLLLLLQRQHQPPLQHIIVRQTRSQLGVIIVVRLFVVIQERYLLNFNLRAYAGNPGIVT